MKSLLIALLLVSTFSFAQKSAFICGTNDDEISAMSAQIMKNLPDLIKQRNLKKAALDDFYFCRLVIDIDSDTYKKYNGDTLLIKHEVVNMVQKASIIFEKQIQTKLAVTHINIWQTPETDPYAGITDIFTLLNRLRSTFTNNAVLSKIPSDIYMYLPTKNFTGAGGVASGKFNVSPWNVVETIAHEIGHNFGSPHTQSCSWPGGAIDYCYAVEGSCYSEALEDINGTIMSYCNRSLDVFHPLCIELMSRNSAIRYPKIVKITDQIKLDELWKVNTNAVLTWLASTYAENYLVEIASDLDFKNVVFRDTVQQSFVSIPSFKKNQVYFTRVQASNRLGIGPWSTIMKVQTPSNWIETPKILSPFNNAINVNGTNLLVSFEGVNGISEYQYQIVPYNTNFNSFSFENGATATVSNTSFTLPNYNAEAVSWRLRAKQGANFGAWSRPFTYWLAPRSANLDLVQQAINGYPIAFSMNYFGNVGHVLEVGLKVSENANFSNPIVNKKWALSKYAGQRNYPYFLKNLKPNTNYYIRYEELNNDPFNIIGLPKGLVRFSERTFKTGIENLPTSLTYFNNSNVENLSRNLKKVVFNKDFAFVSSNEGIVRMKADGTESRLINRDNSKGNISNTLLDIKTDAKGDLWVLTRVSKRIAFDGVFPKTTYRLARVGPANFEVLESADFFGGSNASFVSFDPQTKTLSDGRRGLHSINADSTKPVFQVPITSQLTSIQWAKSSYWLLVFNNNTRINEIIKVNVSDNQSSIFNSANSVLSSSISQIYVDGKDVLWAVNNSGTSLLKYSTETGWNPVVAYKNAGTVRIIGENEGTLYLFNINGLKREVYSLRNEALKVVANITHTDPSGNFEVDKSGKIWFLQSDKLLRINPCGAILAPILSTNKPQIIAGQNVELKAEGCTSVSWTWQEDGKSVQTQTILNSNKLTATPKESVVYKAQCIDAECSSDLSNFIEVNVLSLALVGLDKKKYCANELVEYSFISKGKYDAKNELFAVFENGNTKVSAAIALSDGKYKSSIPSNLGNGLYWLKLQSTIPVIKSLDSIQVSIFQNPSIKSIKAESSMYLLDSTKVTIELDGTPPFKLVFDEKSLNTSSNIASTFFNPIIPKNYSLTLSQLSDGNCASASLVNNTVNIKVELNPKYASFWIQSFPNPIFEDLNLSVYNKPNDKLSVDLFDQKGRLIFTKNYPINLYLEKYKVDFRNISSGMYFLKLNTGTRNEVRKIIKL